MNNACSTIAPKDGGYRAVDSDAPFASFPRQIERPPSTNPGAPVIRSRDNTDVASSRLIPLASREFFPEVQRLAGLIVGRTLKVDESLDASTMGALCRILKDPDCGLSRLDISINEETMSPDVARMLSAALKVNRTLAEFRLHNQGPDSAAAASLMDGVAEALKINRTLTSLHFSSITISDDIAGRLSDALTVNRSMTGLYLSNIAIGADGSARLLEALKLNATITALDLSNSGNADAAALLWEMVKVNKTLTTLHLRGSDLRADEVMGLLNALKVNNTLAELDLSGSRIGDEGMEELSQALECNGTLTSLDLRACMAGYDGIATLARSLKLNLTLASLQLPGRRNDEDADHRSSIASSLQRNQQLSLMKEHAAGFMELASGSRKYPPRIFTLIIEQMAALPWYRRQNGIATIEALSAAIGGPARIT